MHPAARGQTPNVPANRRGTTLVEVLIAGILLGTVMTIAVPGLQWVVRERRAAERRQQATLEVENVMEQFTARGWNGITQDNADDVAPADAVQEQLPQAELKCTVTEITAAPPAKRIAVELRWSNRPGQLTAPVRLTTWVYEGRPE